MEELFKPIPGYEGLYEVSNLGRVKSLPRIRKGNKGADTIVKERIMSLSKVKDYYCVGLAKDGIQKQYRVHRLVALAFIPNPDNLPQVNHKDENKSNNCVENLEWCDEEYNMNYGTRTERAISKMIKTKYSNGVFKYPELKGLRSTNNNLYRRLIYHKKKAEQ